MSIHFPTLSSNEPQLNRAARIAAGDIAGNCMPFATACSQNPGPV